MSEFAHAPSAAAPDFAPVFMRFPNPKMADQAASTLFSAHAEAYISEKLPTIVSASISKDEIIAYQTHGIEIVPAHQYEIFQGFTFNPRSGHDLSPLQPGADTSHVGKSLADVLDQIEAPRAWETSRGRGGPSLSLIPAPAAH